jgi:prepilin-type N-terminal cleavage/methylation domain-containing protein
MKQVSSQKNKGFTLLETLIAIALLAVALGAAFGVAQKALSSSTLSKNQTTGFFMATEGLELVRNIRDNVMLYNKTQPSESQKDWLKPFKTACALAETDTITRVNCVFDVDPAPTIDLTADGNGNLVNQTAIKNSAATDCTPEFGCRLKLITTPAGVTYYTSAPNTGTSIYSRKITIQERCYSNAAGTQSGPCGPTMSNRREAVVTSSVFWMNTSNVYTVVETITNWR